MVQPKLYVRRNSRVVYVLVVDLGSYFFFFSSRRRHTRLQGDWSSDVCSSDLNSALPLVNFGMAMRAVFLSPMAIPKFTSGRAEFGSITVLPPGPPSRRAPPPRSEERRVGKEGRSRWSPDHLKKKKNRDVVCA